MIYILVPTFARIKDTKNFLSSLHKCIDKDYLILIMDDHPDKVTFKSIQQNKHVKVLSSEKELWWVGSINLGIKTLFDNYGLKSFLAFKNIGLTKKYIFILFFLEPFKILFGKNLSSVSNILIS